MAEESQTCIAKVHRGYEGAKPMPDEFFDCGEPVLRGNYCVKHLPEIYAQALMRLSVALADTKDLSVHILELSEPSSRTLLFMNIESQLTEIKRQLAEKL